MTKIQADVSPRNTVIASINSGCPPLSTMYTNRSERIISEVSVGVLMRDMSSSSTSKDCSKDSIVTFGDGFGDCFAVLVASLGASEVSIGCGAADKWIVEDVELTGVNCTDMGRLSCFPPDSRFDWIEVVVRVCGSLI